MYSLIDPEYHEWMGLTTIGIGIIYFSTIVMLKEWVPDDVMIPVRYILTAIVLLILATTIQFCGYTTVIWWSIEAVLLLFLGIRLRLPYVWWSALVLLSFALIKLLLTDNTFAYQPITDYTFIVNYRVLAFSVLAAMLGAGILIVKRLESEIRLSLQTILHTGWCILLFILLTVEIDDYFRRQMLSASSNELIDINFTRPLILAGVWTVYSLVLVSCGVWRNVISIVIAGLSIIGIAALLGVSLGLVFLPIDKFTPILNIRFAVLLLIIASVQIESFTAKKKMERYEWLAGMRVGLQIAASFVGFILLTVETRDYFTAIIASNPKVDIDALTFDRSMALTVIWGAYSLLLVWMGIKRKISSDVILGLCVLALAVLLGVIWGIGFVPIQKYLLIVNIRFFMRAFLIVTLVLNARWLKNTQHEYSWGNRIVPISTIIIILVGYCLLTFETTDVFRKMIFNFQQMSDMNNTMEGINRLSNLEQLILSGVWLVYSILLIAAGIWRRLRIVRIAAIVFFGLSIVKIFIYDLSFLDTLYRIFSFIGLGVILLIVSFLYQRFRSIIIGSPAGE
jgi:uncharacterized membrane protein